MIFSNWLQTTDVEILKKQEKQIESYYTHLIRRQIYHYHQIFVVVVVIVYIRKEIDGIERRRKNHREREQSRQLTSFGSSFVSLSLSFPLVYISANIVHFFVIVRPLNRSFIFSIFVLIFRERKGEGKRKETSPDREREYPNLIILIHVNNQ